MRRAGKLRYPAILRITASSGGLQTEADEGGGCFLPAADMGPPNCRQVPRASAPLELAPRNSQRDAGFGVFGKLAEMWSSETSFSGEGRAV